MKTSIKICIILICSLQTFAFDKKSDDLKKIQKLDSLIDSKKNNFLKLFLKLEVYASWRHFNQKIIIPLDSLKKFVCTYQKELGLDTFETKAFSKYIEFYFKNRLKKQDSSKIDFADIAKSVGEIIMKRQMIEGLKYAFYGHLCEELEPLLIEEKTKQLKGNKLALITKPTTLLLFYEYYKSILNEANEDIIDDENNNLLENTYFLNQNLSKIQARMDYILDLTYCQYKYASTSSKALKSIHLSTDNDFFAINNEDRNMTGAGRIELTTDLLKMRLVKSFNASRILTYQSLYVGMEIYTPMIRFRNEDVLNLLNSNEGPFALPSGVNNNLKITDLTNPKTGFYTEQGLSAAKMILNAVQSEDRPFSGFAFVGRSKYRLNINGYWRVKSDVKVGKIGGLASDNIQALLHRDFLTGSRRVLNWENRIAAGGRGIFNIDHTFDFMLLSEKCYTTQKIIKPGQYLNIYMPIGVHFGSYYTAIDVGIGYSNRNFQKLSGTNEMNLVKAYNRTLFGNIFQNLVINSKFYIQNVIHSTSMEGFGFLKTLKDDPNDDENISVYTINKVLSPTSKIHKIDNSETQYILPEDNIYVDARSNQDFVKRMIWKWDTQIGFRLNKATFYYNLNIGNAEFTKQQSQFHKIYGFGRLGLMFYL